MFRTRTFPVAGLFVFSLALAGCSSGTDDLVVTWKGHDKKGAIDKVQIFDGGDTSLTSSNGTTCKGKLNTDDEPYKLDFDCGIAKAIATVKLADDGESMTLTLNGEDERFTKTGD